tara:strand:- start:852 stop:1961 length:1110 start_codon:yes stop_codon:yes gene_type:complete
VTQKNFYLDFENTFRGTRSSIMNRISVYNDLLYLIFKRNPQAKLLDIGCGRGEWLQNCRDNGFEVLGIDDNQDMVDFSQDLGLNAIKAEAKLFVKSCNSNSYDFITLFHVIEHLKDADFFSLMVECQRILKPDGLLLIETPNIDNIQVSTRTFYIDPTHINHINPDYVDFLLKRVGFYKSRYYFINSEKYLDKIGLNKLINLYKGVGYDMLFIATNSSNIDTEFFDNQNTWVPKMNIALGSQEFIRKYDKYNLEKFNTIDNKLIEISEMQAKLDRIYRVFLNLKLFYIFDLFEELRSKGLIRFTYKKMKSLLKRFIYYVIKIFSRIDTQHYKASFKSKRFKNIFLSRYKFYPKSHQIYLRIKSRIKKKN